MGEWGTVVSEEKKDNKVGVVTITQKRGGRIMVRPKRLTTLVMLSGGIDSIYRLVKLLDETDDDVLVHHIHLVNQEGRHKVEAERVRKIVKWCESKYRKVKYSESGVDHRGFLFFGYDMVTVGFEAGIVSHSFFAAHNRMPDRWMIGACTEEPRWLERWEHVKACLAANCFPQDPPEYFAFPTVTKLEEVRYLPAELVEMAWTCRTPVVVDGEYTECGKCQTCELMIKVRKENREKTA